MLTVVIDTAEKIEDFIKVSGPDFKEVVFDYYLNFIPFINSLVFPLYNLIAVVFFTARLASNTEFVAMTGNGINYYRLLVPYLIGAFIIAGIHYYGNHYLIPRSNIVRTGFENTYIWKHNYVGKSANLHVACSPTEEYFIQGFNKFDSSGSNFAWIRHDTSMLQRKRVLMAKKIKLMDKKNQWRLSGIRYRDHIDQMQFNVEEKPPQFIIDTVLCLEIGDLIKRDNKKDNMTTDELIHYIEAQKRKGLSGTKVFEVERHRRSADSFSIILLTIIGFSMASKKIRGGMAWHLVIGLALSASFIFMTKFSTTLSISGDLPPIIGVWLPNFLFSIVALVNLVKADK